MKCSPTSTSSIIKPLVLLLLLSLNVIVNADSLASSYFSNVSTDEKEVYTNWVATHSSSYPRHTFMPSSSSNDKDGAAIFWNINNDDTIDFAIAVRSEGWVGFGLSEAGGMMGSDMALFSNSNPDDIVDAYVVDDRSTPLEDDCQDWTLKDTTTTDGWIIVEFSRLLDTQDNQDLSIKNDVNLWSPATRIIAAWGDSDDISYHGQKKARSSVRLFATHSNELSEMEAQIETLSDPNVSDGYFDFTEDNFTIPAVDTHYEDVCKEFNQFDLNLPEGQNMVTMVGVVPLIDDESAQFVHHFIVSLQKDCTQESFLTRTMVYAWAPGDEGWALPDDVGFPMFDNVNNQAIHLEIHYDNPSLIEGRKDSSGLRFFYSNNERKNRAGILQVGDPFLALNGQEIKDGLTQYEFTCPSTCSSSILAKERSGDNQAVTVFSEFLHMHQSGIHMKNEVIRGEEVIHTATSEVYDFEQQGAYHHPQDSYEVLPGDSFRVTCSYKDGTAFGLSSSEEMCISFFYYYPAKTLMGDIPWTCPFQPFWTEFGVDTTLTCATELEHAELNDINELGRSFGKSSSDQCASDSSNGGDDNDNDESSSDQQPDIIVVDPEDMEDEDSAGWFGGVPILFTTLSILTVACLM